MAALAVADNVDQQVLLVPRESLVHQESRDSRVKMVLEVLLVRWVQQVHPVSSDNKVLLDIQGRRVPLEQLE